MPLYTYICDLNFQHQFDAVRPFGIDLVQCRLCAIEGVDSVAQRREVYRTHVVGPTVNTLRDSDFALAREAMDEREHIFASVEQDLERPIGRPNDWAGPQRIAREMLLRGEVDVKQVLRETEGQLITGSSL